MMRIPYVIVYGILLVASPLFARDKVDVLVMNNGDRLTCEIKGLASGVLYIGLDYAEGTVQVDWSKVKHVESKQLFLVETQDGRFYVGTLSMAETETERPLQIEVVEEAGNNVVVRQGEVVEIDQTSQNFWHRFDGSINLGFTYAKANQTTQYTLGTTTEYLRETWSAGANLTSTLTGNTEVETSTRNNVQTYYRHLMRWNNWFYTGLGSFLQSTEQQIQLQSNVGGGIGLYLKNTNGSTINFYGGVAYQKTTYTHPESRTPLFDRREGEAQCRFQTIGKTPRSRRRTGRNYEGFSCTNLLC
jgi:hypothetical protein